MRKKLLLAALLVAALYVSAPAQAANVAVVGGTISASDPTFTHLANHSCTTSSGQTTHYDAIQFFTVGSSPTTISVSVTPSGFTGAVFLYQGGFLPGFPIANCYDTASSVVGTVSGGTLSFSTNMGALPAPFTEEPWTLVVTTSTAASSGGTYSASISSSTTGIALPSTTKITGVTPEPSNAGDPVDISWTVANQFDGTPAPSGTVTVTTDGPESCSAPVSDGHCTIVFATAGDRQLEADYSGDPLFQASADFTDHIVNGQADITPPDVTAPANIVVEATGPQGAIVLYPPATAVDAVDGPLPVICTPASGSTFALGTTTVTCSATDAAGNTGTASFTITVVDTTAPSLTVPANIVAEATSPSGAAVSYVANAVDTVDGPVPVTCTPASGSTFPLGTATVTCVAVDAHGNTTVASFTVTVQDTTAPVYGPAANVSVNATSPSGAVVTFPTPTATDAVGVVSNTCLPAAGSTFPIGTTTVTCQAADAAGNHATTTFTVTVVSAAGQITALIQKVQQIAPPPALGASLTSKLQQAQAYITAGDIQDACTTLQGFINLVAAQSGKKLSTTDAAALIASAQQIRAVLGC